jgi:hypothetical protein
MKRVGLMIFDTLLNGVVLYGVFLLLFYGFLSVMPTSFWFTYHSVEPATIPAEINKDYIAMRSTLTVRQEVNMNWNDVLRCKSPTGMWSFYSQYDSSAQTITVGENKVSEWKWRGIMPQTPALCRVDSTITTNLSMGVEKKQFIQSQEFLIE